MTALAEQLQVALGDLSRSQREIQTRLAALEARPLQVELLLRASDAEELP